MKRAANFTMYFIIAAAIILKMPNIIDNIKAEGKSISPQKVYYFESEKSQMPIVYPSYGKKSIAVFWASWCGPCGIELSRINKAIENKEINADRIFAISLDQDLQALEKTILEKKYAFKTYLDKENTISTLLKINSTPTIVFIDETGKVSWQTTGVSPFLINRIKNFIN